MHAPLLLQAATPTFHLHRCTAAIHFPIHLFHYTRKHPIVLPRCSLVNTEPPTTPLNRVSQGCGIVDQLSVFVPCDGGDGFVVESSCAASEDCSLMCSRGAVGRLDCHFSSSWSRGSKSGKVCRRCKREGKSPMHYIRLSCTLQL